MEGINTKPKKGEIITITPDKAAFEGACVGRTESGFAMFISGCVPGDTVKARVGKVRKSYAEAKTLEVINSSEHRIEPKCMHFGSCGGCKWQNLNYKQQTAWKRQHVVDAFLRIGHLENVNVLETISCEEPFFYRNKMEFSFGDTRWITDAEIASGAEIKNRNFALGLHAPARYDRVLEVQECFLQSELSNKILNFTREFFQSRETTIYNTHTHSGLLRNLCIRQTAQAKEQSDKKQETMVIIVTAQEATDLISEYARELQSNIPEVTTLVQGINRGKSQVAFTTEINTLYGSGVITESIAGNSFEISPFSFFQTNTKQAETLYSWALQAAELKVTDNVWDLYCGAGTITLALAKFANRVLGVELNEGAIIDAKKNATRNNITNVDFIAGDCRSIVAREDLFKPSVIVTDPPRAGMHADIIEMIKTLLPRTVVYVSCNPTTQARDCEALSQFYNIDFVQPVDMFPQTYHIETVARLSLK